MSDWYRVEDDDRKQVCFVQADDEKHAVQVYLAEYRPDLYVKKASELEVRAWKQDPNPWPTG